MKRESIHIFAYLAVFVCALSLTQAIESYDWNISSRCQTPRPGDRLHAFIIEWDAETAALPEFDDRKSYSDTVWDLTRCGYIDNRYIISYERGKTEDEIIEVLDGYRKNYLRVAGDTIFRIGYESRNLLMNDSVGVVRSVFSLDRDSLVRKPFQFAGIYSMEHSAVRYGECTSHSGRLGTVILPDGDTITDVRYVRTTETFNSDLSLDSDRLITAYSDSLPRSVVSTVDCYAPGYRYPILSVTRTDRIIGDSRVTPKFDALVCPPYEQELDVANDRANEDMRADISGSRRGENDGGFGNPGQETIRDVNVTIEGNTLAIGFESGEPTGFIELIVSDSSGIRYRHQPRVPITEGKNDLTLDCSGMPPQEYALMLICGTQTLRLKFTLR